MSLSLRYKDNHRLAENSGTAVKQYTLWSAAGTNDKQHVPSHYIGPGTSAAANHHAACLSPVGVYLGCSQEDDVSFPATRCTRVSTNMSLIRLPRTVVDESSCNAHHGAV